MFVSNVVPQGHLLSSVCHMHRHSTISLIHQQPIGASEVNGIPDCHVVQVLGQLSSLWEGGMGVLVVHLEEVHEGHKDESLTPLVIGFLLPLLGLENQLMAFLTKKLFLSYYLNMCGVESCSQNLKQCFK